MPPYSATLMDHVLSPRNGGPMDAPDAVGKASLNGRAPYVTIYLRREGSIVARAMFQTFGCGVSIACCSVLTEIAAGRSLDECHALTRQTILDFLAGIPEEKQFCADMAIEAFQNALASMPPKEPNTHGHGS